MKKFYQFLPALVFLVFLAVMAGLLLFSPLKEYSENEKRYLAGPPEVTVEKIMDGSTQKELEKFTSDQIPGRDMFVGINAYWNLLTGRNGAQDIYYCKDNYLINAPESYNEQTYLNNLKNFDDFAASVGLPADLIMVPSTGYLMDRVLPISHGEYHDDVLYQKAIETLRNIRLIDVRQPLKDGTLRGQVCYRTDHHLTSFGNYLIYQNYQNAVGASWLPQDAYTVTSYDGFYGTTWSGSGYRMIPPDKVDLWDSGANVTVTLQDGGKEPVVSDSLFFPSHLENLDKYPVYLDGNHSLVEISNPDAEGGSILVIRDSYAHCLGTFLASSYQKIYMVDLRYYRDSLSEFLKEHPVDRILYLYGVDNMMTDTNSAWLN